VTDHDTPAGRRKHAAVGRFHAARMAALMDQEPGMSATEILFHDVFLVWVWVPTGILAIYATVTKDW